MLKKQKLKKLEELKYKKGDKVMKDKKCPKKSTIRISGELTCQAQVGWICPRCGRGVAPWAKECSCVPPFVIYSAKNDLSPTNGKDNSHV